MLLIRGKRLRAHAPETLIRQRDDAVPVNKAAEAVPREQQRSVDVGVIGELANDMVRRHRQPLCIGQKQKWFLLRMLGTDSDVCFHHNEEPEFDHWRWVSYWYPLGQVVSFKREVYRRALLELAPRLQAGTTGR